MKKLSLALAAFALCGAASAATTNRNFDVTVNFTSACTAVSGPATLAFGNYTAFSGAVNLTAAAFSFDCSRNTNATASFGVIGRGASTSTTANTGYFSTAGLNYFLTVSAPTVTPGTAATAANGSIGSAENISVNVGGTIPQQAGINNSATPAIDTDQRTLVITF